MQSWSKIRQATSGNQKWLNCYLVTFAKKIYGSNIVHILEKSALASQTVVVLSTTKIYEDSLAFDAVITTWLSLTPTLSDTLFDKPNMLLSYFLSICHFVLDSSDTIHHCHGTFSSFELTPCWPSANSQE
jgi:hypothetical protein